MDVVKSLATTLGLTDTEASVYLAGLGRPSIGVAEVVRLTGVKRPTAYHALETLLQKGAVAKKNVGGKTAFTMTPPQLMNALFDRRIDALAKQKTSFASLLPHLETRAASAGVAGGSAEVSQFNGVEAVKALVDEALYCRSRKWDIISPRANFFSEAGKVYADDFMNTRRQRGITARSLWEKIEGAVGRGISAEEARIRQPRYLPKAMNGTFPSTIILFDDKVAMLSSGQPPSGVLIRSADMHATLRAMFEGLYAISEPYAIGTAPKSGSK